MELHIPKNLLALNYLLFKKLLTAFAVLYVQCDLHRTRTSGLNHSRWFISALFSFQGTPPSAALSLSESAFISYLIQFFLSRTFFRRFFQKLSPFMRLSPVSIRHSRLFPGACQPLFADDLYYITRFFAPRQEFFAIFFSFFIIKNIFQHSLYQDASV